MNVSGSDNIFLSSMVLLHEQYCKGIHAPPVHPDNPGIRRRGRNQGLWSGLLLILFRFRNIFRSKRQHKENPSWSEVPESHPVRYSSGQVYCPLPEQSGMLQKYYDLRYIHDYIPDFFWSVYHLDKLWSAPEVQQVDADQTVFHLL